MKQRVPIADITVGKRHRKAFTKIDELAASIEDIGLLHPVVVTPDSRLVAGRRRLKACRQLGWTDVPIRVVDIESIVRGERDENVQREDYTPSEAVAIADAIEVIERREAKARQREHGGTAPGKSANTCADSTQVSETKSRTRTARAVGMGWQALSRAREVVGSGDEDLVAEMDRTGRVAGVHKKLTVRRQAAEIAKEAPPLPKGPFRVIVADPPWTYSGRPDDPSHRSANPYESMTLDDIKAYLPDSMPTKDCILWLWTTNSHMREAFEVVEAWGFQHKTILTWVKHKMGTGDWLRGKTEHCLMAVRGKPTVTLTNQTTVLNGKAGKHSAKPDEFYALVRALCPGSRVELFQRTPRDGFIGAGLEA